MNEEWLVRFFSKVKKTRSCWLWIASRTPSGYGRLTRNRYAHRVSWEIHRGAIPKGKHVLHRCDNPSCVNPEHLWLGTHSENMADRERKGRSARNFSNEKLKLGDIGRIIEMRKNGVHQAEIARIFGVGESRICQIVKKYGGETFNTNGSAKISMSDAQRIRKMMNSGISSKEIMATFPISRSQINAIFRGSAWLEKE